MSMSKRYDDLFSECCKMTPCKPDKVVFWRPSGPWTIFIRFVDGSECEYNGTDQTLHMLWQTDNDDLTEEEMLIKFGYALGRKMRSAGHNAITLAAATGLGQATIYRYLSGKAQPTFLNVHKICKALRCSLSELDYYI